MVHNHGPYEGEGLDCNETLLSDGSLRGACLMKYTSHGQPMPSTIVPPDTVLEISPECSGVYSCLKCHAEIRANFDIDNPEYKKFWDAHALPVTLKEGQNDNQEAEA